MRQHILGKKHLKAVTRGVERGQGVGMVVSRGQGVQEEDDKLREGMNNPVKEGQEQTLKQESASRLSKQKLLSLLPDSASRSLVILERPDRSVASSFIPDLSIPELFIPEIFNP